MFKFKNNSNQIPGFEFAVDHTQNTDQALFQEKKQGYYVLAKKIDKNSEQFKFPCYDQLNPLIFSKVIHFFENEFKYGLFQPMKASITMTNIFNIEIFENMVVIVINALKDLSLAGLCHNDIRLENIYFDFKDGKRYFKIGNFRQTRRKSQVLEFYQAYIFAIELIRYWLTWGSQDYIQSDFYDSKGVPQIETFPNLEYVKNIITDIKTVSNFIGQFIQTIFTWKAKEQVDLKALYKLIPEKYIDLCEMLNDQSLIQKQKRRILELKKMYASSIRGGAIVNKKMKKVRQKRQISGLEFRCSCGKTYGSRGARQKHKMIKKCE